MYEDPTKIEEMDGLNLGLSSVTNSRMACGAVCAVIALLAWRLWTFTLKPSLYPQRPKVYPYWIPGIGHLTSFFIDPNSTITAARNHFSNSRAPFALILAGQTVYVLTSAKDYASMLKNHRQLSFDEIIGDLHEKIGTSKQGRAALWAEPDATKENMERKGTLPNPRGKNVHHLLNEWLRIQLRPGGVFDELQSDFMGSLHRAVTWDNIPSQNPSAGKTKTVSVRSWVSTLLMSSATNVFFGHTLLENEPTLLESFAQFDDSSWKLMYGLPEIFARDLAHAKGIAHSALVRYFSSPPDERSDACSIIKGFETEMRAAGISTNDIAAFMLLIYWVINGNAWKVCFWLIAYITHTSTTCAQITTELTPLVTALDAGNITPDTFTARLDNCTFLNACYREAMRVCGSSVAARIVSEDCIINNVTLQKGAQLMVPLRQLMMDEAVWGTDVGEFRPQRFVERPELARDPSYRPFGGGMTFCPGRFLAQKEVLTLTALLFGRFEVRAEDGGRTFPRMEERKPTIGVMCPAEGEDMRIVVGKRAEPV